MNSKKYEEKYLEKEYRLEISENTREGLIVGFFFLGSAIALSFSLMGPVILFINPTAGIVMIVLAVLFWYWFNKITGDDY